MSKKYHLKTEYAILILAIVGIILLLMPISIENTRQANFISKWNEKYNRVEYMFSVMNAHITEDMLKSMKNAKDPSEREQILLMIIKPYLRINTVNRPNRFYKPRYKNGSKIFKGQDYYFDEFYFSASNSVIGIKDTKTKNVNDPFFIMMFDINGTMLPNRWGKDIFGINIYDGGKVEPFGFDKNMEELKSDCSKSGTGVMCSYYYKIGGDFDD